MGEAYEARQARLPLQRQDGVGNLISPGRRYREVSSCSDPDERGAQADFQEQMKDPCFHPEPPRAPPLSTNPEAGIPNQALDCRRRYLHRSFPARARNEASRRRSAMENSPSRMRRSSP